MNLLLAPFVFFSALPFVPFLLVYGIHYFWNGRRDRRKSLLLAVDVTTVFLILSVSALFNQIFVSGFGFYFILLLLLIIGGLIGGAQNRMKGKVDVKRLVRAVWRLAFLGAGFAYILFVIIGFSPYIFRV
ncbi:DUF3397 domain-containing protein [Paenibacillus sp. YPG26]|uniref:DUF3397 domain-containing protein n=1 Tax=Paenibacillus sp. YPG26 TaxID=2878915 RepID=UPI00203D1A2F|nr:DUF3397 domain-containing protein [Paenibacillus sp. YPG26]USB35016.1 DUF3397 domain-containing protein [Paenibacillus sp. YPG26]